MADAELNMRLRELEMRIAQLQVQLNAVAALIAQLEAQTVIIRSPGIG